MREQPAPAALTLIFTGEEIIMPPSSSMSSNRVQVVGSLKDLFNARFDPAHAIMYPRKLTQDFNALAHKLAEITQMHDFDSHHRFMAVDSDGEFPNLKEIAKDLDGPEAQALAVIIADMDRIFCHTGRPHPDTLFLPELRLIGPGGYRTDPVELFHTDAGSADDVLFGRMCCCYNAPTTEYIRNEDSVKADAQLLSQAKSPVPEGYESFFYDVRPGAEILSVEPGTLWRQTFDDTIPGLEPFIHRGLPGEPYRLFLTTQVNPEDEFKPEDLEFRARAQAAGPDF